MHRRDLLLGLGGALVASAAARAEQRMAVVGVLSSSAGSKPQFAQGLNDAGYYEGRNLAILYQIAEGQYEELPAMAADLVHRKVDVIAAFGAPAVRAAKNATSTIPVVFVSGEPIVEGLVPNLARPGGNLTGVSLMDVDLMPKRLEFLSEMVPTARSFALLVNPDAATAAAVIRVTEEAARARGVALHVLKANSYDAIDAAFKNLLPQHIGGVIVQPDSLFVSRMSYLPGVALRDAVPTIYDSNLFAWAGGLISYGPDLFGAYRQLGAYAGRILRGEKPADLPVQQPTRFDLAINLRAAKALRLTVPQSLLVQADEVIE